MQRARMAVADRLLARGGLVDGFKRKRDFYEFLLAADGVHRKPYVSRFCRCEGNHPTTACSDSSSQKKYSRKQYRGSREAPFLRWRSSNRGLPPYCTSY